MRNEKIERTHTDRKEERCKVIKRGETLAGQNKKLDYALKAEEKRTG